METEKTETKEQTTETAPVNAPPVKTETTSAPVDKKTESKQSLMMDPTSLVENMDLKNMRIKELESRLATLEDFDNKFNTVEAKVGKYNTYLTEISKQKFESNKEYFSDFLDIEAEQWRSAPLEAIEYMDKLTDLYKKISSKLEASLASDPTRSKTSKDEQVRLETDLDFKQNYYELVKNGVKKPK